ncbi:MAG TPA: HD domain-containing phosphohydrolase [Solirubrobacteraceae bacterium]|nr:HD domain-containing phosphohydrolase [Solirubrobacteraceae bacterium]
MSGHPQRIALSEVIGGLSYALDVTEGERPGHAVRSCLVGMRLAQELELDSVTRSHLFYALLLKDAGCSANSDRMAALFGADDHVAKRTSKRVNWAGKLPAFVWAVRTVAPRGSARARIDRLRAIKDEGQVTRALMQARCDRGAEIAYLLGFDAETAEAIRALDEHWDGYGQPRGLRGEETPLLGRLLCLAQTVEIFHAAGGVTAACRMAKRRSGGWFDPALVEALCSIRDDAPFWRSLAEADVSAWEPGDRLLTADDESLDRIAYAFAGVIDAKSPWTYRHSDRLSVIVVGLATALGAGAQELNDLRRAALLHDLGKLALSSRILDKPGSLTEAEFAQVREHPVVTRRILERVPGFRQLAPVAAAHHERLDGGGYPDGLTAGELTMPMRLLAVADVYEALTSERPYRNAMSSRKALEIVRGEVPHRLDGAASEALQALADDDAVPDHDSDRVRPVLDGDGELVARQEGPRRRPA